MTSSAAGPRVLLLDLDGTLLDHRAAADAAITGWVTALLGSAPDGLAQRWAAWEEEHVTRAERGEVTWREQRRHRLSALLDHLGLPARDDAALDGLFADFLAHYAGAWTGYDDVGAAFESWVAAGVRLGVVTNGVHEQQVAKLAALGVLEHVEEVVALDDVGVGKPDPRIYLEACRRLGVAPADCVYVGDDAVRDALGAAAAGLRGVWLNRVGAARVDGVVHEVSTLLDVAAHLRD